MSRKDKGPSRVIANRRTAAEVERATGRRLVKGMDCEIVDDATAEEADVVVCSEWTMPLHRPDNETGPCPGCGAMLQWRPHAPKRPPRMRLFRAEVDARKEGAGPEVLRAFRMATTRRGW